MLLFTLGLCNLTMWCHANKKTDTMWLGHCTVMHMGQTTLSAICKRRGTTQKSREPTLALHYVCQSWGHGRKQLSSSCDNSMFRQRWSVTSLLPAESSSPRGIPSDCARRLQDTEYLKKHAWSQLPCHQRESAAVNSASTPSKFPLRQNFPLHATVCRTVYLYNICAEEIQQMV